MAGHALRILLAGHMLVSTRLARASTATRWAESAYLAPTHNTRTGPRRTINPQPSLKLAGATRLAQGPVDGVGPVAAIVIVVARDAGQHGSRASYHAPGRGVLNCPGWQPGA